MAAEEAELTAVCLKFVPDFLKQRVSNIDSKQRCPEQNTGVGVYDGMRSWPKAAARSSAVS